MYQVENSRFEYFKRSNGRDWRRGVTTGTCAAGAAKAAALMLINQELVTQVSITTPQALTIKLPVSDSTFTKNTASCCVVKDGGDDPDVTHGAKICAQVSWSREQHIKILGGLGVGKVTKPGLSIAVGEAAINPVPRQMIVDSLQEVLPPNRGVQVIISVPNGQELAKKTLNAELGIVDGISILGTTGIVEPMSEEAYKFSLAQAYKITQAQGKTRVALTPGKIGQKIAQEKLGIQDVIQMSNFVGYMLEEANSYGISEVLLVGHIGKLVKVAAGNFNTHNRYSDARRETIAAHAALHGASQEVIRQLMETVTTEAAIEILKETNLQGIYSGIASQATKRAESYSRHTLKIGTILLDMAGNVLGHDPGAESIGGKLGWQIS